MSAQTWLTVDSDDLRHLPVYQGHPTRSKQQYEGEHGILSLRFRQGWSGFLAWMESHDACVTLFVISDLLEQDDFSSLLRDALNQFGTRLTVGCHGHTHRSWSAWGEDKAGFAAMLSRSTALLKDHAGESFRPYFRAPSGYVAPWMAEVLASEGYKVDSSVNPSWLVRKKAAGHRWNEVTRAMKANGLVERPWLTVWSLPVNGPALFRFPLSLLARRAWRGTGPALSESELHSVEDEKRDHQTVYCHVLDFARKKGEWIPPLNLHRA